MLNNRILWNAIIYIYIYIRNIIPFQMTIIQASSQFQMNIQVKDQSSEAPNNNNRVKLFSYKNHIFNF